MVPGRVLNNRCLRVLLQVDVTPTVLNEPLTVSTPLSDCVVVDVVYPSCLVVIHGRDLCADLVALDVLTFDVTLRMDWLAHHYASIDYRGNVNTVPIVNQFTVVFPEEFFRLPPDRDIEFCINVVPVTGPISIPLYRMAPTEMK
ncbi:uncharacterized protein LOC126666511 [Mercurialis annua]|uniref:uncharacterized protein LOC126666511 n=1 Tax=Mercurialis annua TaxID=3986 RepID=UPI00215F7A20|nr:uncharacterized protein LOC126666511 [Mercurialis annua]